jgi:CDP-glucose 4,6-dehydratase
MEGVGVTEIQGKVLPVFWRGKRVLLTGHTGFKGSWLALLLWRMGANVTGVAMPPEQTPSLFDKARVSDALASSQFVDIRDAAALRAVIRAARPEIVIHLAAQPLVRRSYAQPVTTFATNVMGTVHVLEALRDLETARVAVFVTTDKVYANREWDWPYRENDPLGGSDPYSASKAASEMVIRSYSESFLSGHGLNVATARAGNVIGGGDWSDDRLIPDAVRAWQSGMMLEMRRPGAVRPWQHVLEPLNAYLVLAQEMWSGNARGRAYNFGPAPHEAATVRRVIELAQGAWGAGACVAWGDGSDGPHEAGILMLETSQARRVLGVQPRWTLEEAVSRTIQWYRTLHAGSDALELCNGDIDAFLGAA